MRLRALRPLRLLLAALAIGACVNVLVAVAFWIAVHRLSFPPMTSVVTARTWPVQTFDDWPPPARTSVSTRLGVRQMLVSNTRRLESGELAGCSVWIYGYGFPFTALFTAEVDERLFTPSSPVLTNGRSRVVGVQLGRRHVLPTGLHLSGFIANTGIFAAVVLAIVVTQRCVRRRLHKDACEKCGYDLTNTGAGTPCPECGWVRGQWAQTS